MHDKEVSFKKGTDTRINIKVNAQRRSLKALLLLFVEPYTAGDRDSEKFIFLDLTKVSVTFNGSPNMLFNDGIKGKDMWEKAHRFFTKEKNKTEHMNVTKFYTDDKFGLVIDMRSMADQSLHGSGKCIVKSTDGVQLEIERKAKGSGDVKCHVFVISNSQFNIMDRQLKSLVLNITWTQARYPSTLSLWDRLIQANQGLWWTRSTDLSASSSTTLCSSAQHSRTTRPIAELVKMIQE